MVFAILLFAVIFWFGLYLVSHDLTSPRLRFAGLGLVSYALGWACTLLSPFTSTPALEITLARVGWTLFALPACFWTGAMITFLPEDVPFRAHHPADGELVGALAWASFAAARRIGTWIARPGTC